MVIFNKNITLSESIHKWGEIVDSFGIKRCTVEYIRLLKTFQKIESISRLAALGFYYDSPEQLN